jgi:DNA (cytosine-5)-methyltransferase 1
MLQSGAQGGNMDAIVDLFAGPGGWSEGLRMLSPELHALEVGIEWDKAACATRDAAGHRTIQADIAAFPVEQFAGKSVGLIASPPCQDFSMAGKRAGIEGERGQLITEVLRWTQALNPEWVVCEQVPPVLPIWKEYALEMQSWGYSTWVGVLNAADYGVPQTRKRAFLLASRSRQITEPVPTHAKNPEPSLFGSELLPWVTMAEALQWEIQDEVRLNPGVTASQPNRRKYPLDESAPTIAFGHDAANWKWEMNTGRAWKKGGTRDDAQKVPSTSPSPSVTGQSGAWWMVRPSTTIVGSFRPMIVSGPGVDLTRPRQEREGSVRITPQDALVLQSFPVDYPVQGSVTKQFEQIGNAVPPLLAAHVLKTVTGVEYGS